MSKELKTEIAQLMTDAREETLKLFRLVREEDLHASPGFGFRPIIWHLAHMGVFESYWLLQKMKGENAPDERYERIFDPIKTPRKASVNLPSQKEMENYLSRVRDSALRYLDEVTFDENNPMLQGGYIFNLVLQHEYQHQETLCYLLQMLPPEKKIIPAYLDRKQEAESRKQEAESISIAEGETEIGCVWNMFAYDNEFPAHKVFVPAFEIDKNLTTNAQFLRFVEDGGYMQKEFWSEEGWTWREKENWQHPLYWNKKDEVWFEKSMFDEIALRPNHPVVGVSWYEAEAYANFMNKRLPSEAEWEKSASWNEETKKKNLFSWGDETPSSKLCNFNITNLDTTPAGSFPPGESFYGCLDMTGNLWEWTNDSFDAYEGFQHFPYPEYSEEWFDGDHKVLKGGSWATRTPLLRTSFRNFFRRHFRIAFAGIRLAKTV